MSEPVYSIFDYPPPSLRRLHEVLVGLGRYPMDAYTADLLGAASHSFTTWVKDHYDQRHGSGAELCDCAEGQA